MTQNFEHYLKILNNINNHLKTLPIKLLLGLFSDFPQFGHSKAVSLTSPEHSGQFINAITSEPQSEIFNYLFY